MSSARFESADRESSEVAAWAASSMFGPFPRLIVQLSPSHAGCTEFGVAAFVWQMRFPQGGPFVNRVWAPAAQALNDAGFEFSEGAHTFEKIGSEGTQDGEWRAVARPMSG